MPTKAARPSDWYGWLAAGLVVCAIWLAWQIVLAALAPRLPAMTAVQLSPGSAGVLARAAEASMAAGDADNAAWFARRSLAIAPLNVVAMRTLAQAEAESDLALALEMMTIAADWSLRDDIAHGWLFTERLKRGQVSTALAHADVLARRRPDAQPRLIEFLLTASAADPRLVELVRERLETRPPWRTAFFGAPAANDAQAAAKAQLAIALAGAGSLNKPERAALYNALFAEERFGLLKDVRTSLEPEAPYLLGEAFDNGEDHAPFGWILSPSPGWTVERRPGADGTALHITYDGFSGGVALQQLLLLPEGQFQLSWAADGAAGEALAWRLNCAPDGALLTQGAIGGSSRNLDFDVGAACPAQRLSLTGVRGDRRRTLAVKVDSVRLESR